jgi:hypothetical protein
MYGCRVRCRLSLQAMNIASLIGFGYATENRSSVNQRLCRM